MIMFLIMREKMIFYHLGAMLRLSETAMTDFLNVSQYYSKKLVTFIR